MVAEGYLQIAVANIAAAVKRISVQKGHDITRYALTTFGGAPGQHACMVADSLGIRTVLVPPMAGVLSALGIGLADTTAMRERSVEAPLEPAAMPGVHGIADELEAAARAELAAEDVPEERVEVIRRAQLRYDGTDTTLTVRLTDPDTMRRAFEDRHRATYSFTLDRPIARRGSVRRGHRHHRIPDLSALAPWSGLPAAPVTVRLHTGGAWRDVPSTAARTSLPARPSPAPRSSPRTAPRPSSTTAGGPRPPATGIW